VEQSGPATSEDPAFQPRPPLAAPTLVDLCRLSDEAWRALLKGKRDAARRPGRIRARLRMRRGVCRRRPRRFARASLRGHASARFPKSRTRLRGREGAGGAR
jgi:epoxyqueuosine reductase QueG